MAKRPLYYSSLSYHRQTHWLRLVNCQMVNGLCLPEARKSSVHQQNTKAGRWLAIDLRIPELTWAFLQPNPKTIQQR